MSDGDALAVIGETLHDLTHQLAELRQRVGWLEGEARAQIERAALDALKATRDRRARADKKLDSRE
jgi:hypothetical protein